MRFRALSLALLLAAPFSAGCAGELDGTEKQLSDLRAEMSKLRAEEGRLTERLETLELAKGPLHGAVPPPAPAPAAAAPAPPPGQEGDRPDLSVVRLSPGADPDDPDADTPRPLVRVTGSGGSIQEHGGGKLPLGPADDADPGPAKKKLGPKFSSDAAKKKKP